MKTKTTELYLIRHGATDANMREPYILQGCGIDLSLNAVGRQQASAVATFLSSMPLDRIYASRLLRAVETAKTIAAHHNLPVQTVDELVECNVGAWEGMDWDSIMQSHADLCRAFLENPADNPYLEGESYRDVLARVKPVIQRLLEKHAGETIAIVAHNVVNRVYLADLLGLDLKKAKDIRQPNCGVNVIRYIGGKTELRTLNAEFHLQPPAAATQPVQTRASA